MTVMREQTNTHRHKTDKNRTDERAFSNFDFMKFRLAMIKTRDGKEPSFLGFGYVRVLELFGSAWVLVE